MGRAARMAFGVSRGRAIPAQRPGRGRFSPLPPAVAAAPPSVFREAQEAQPSVFREAQEAQPSVFREAREAPPGALRAARKTPPGAFRVAQAKPDAHFSPRATSETRP